MSDIPTDPAPQGGIDSGALAHAIAGISAAVLGGLMYTRPWAQDIFSILMIVAAVSGVYFTWKHSAWVTGHWLAMVPVTGVILGFMGWQWAIPCLRDFVDRFYSLCYQGRAVAARR